MDTQQWTVLNPVSKVDIEARDGAARIDDFSDKRLGLWWNGKPNGDVFLNEVAAELASRSPGMTTVRLWEIDPATVTFYGVPRDNLERMAHSADLVIGALGD